MHLSTSISCNFNGLVLFGSDSDGLSVADLEGVGIHGGTAADAGKYGQPVSEWTATNQVLAPRRSALTVTKYGTN